MLGSIYSDEVGQLMLPAGCKCFRGEPLFVVTDLATTLITACFDPTSVLPANHGSQLSLLGPTGVRQRHDRYLPSQAYRQTHVGCEFSSNAPARSSAWFDNVHKKLFC